MRVLLIEDDSATAQSIELMLKSENFNTYTTDLGEEGVDLGKLYDYDIILLDLNLPDMSGYEVLRSLRVAKVKTPILILSGMAGIEDKVRGLGFGADDYMTKPFHKDELVARIHAILRRTKAAEVEESVIEVGEIKINQDAHDVFVNGTIVELSPTEYKLLRFLISNPNRVLTKAQILDHVWEYDFNGEMGIVESYVSYLRKKLDPLTSEPLIQTKRGVGYMYKTAKNSK